MPLDPHVKRFLHMVSAGGIPEASELTPAEMRQAILRLAQTVDVKDISIGKTENRELPGPGGPLPIRIYIPAAINTDKSAGLVYFHGGTGVFCTIETHDGLCRMLANESSCRIISVGYRLAPEHKFPAAVEDSYFAIRWVFEHASELGIAPNRIAVGGDSAGGTLAAVVCQLARQAGGPNPALQVLFCPVTDVIADTESRKAFAEHYFFDKTTMEWALKHYCPPGIDLEDPRISPLRASDLAGLPPAHIHTAEFDPLRDEGKAYADRLERAGVKVRYTCHAGMIHHFYGMGGVIPYARLAMRAAGTAIRESL
ncbi:MAG TPA: alpha/beta hydrolase [Candidatus Binataceae bacterium]|nr:alpha/beta hydrolase [Candidatus Binataceae bacterium]